ncbi:hypothetical protein EI42_04500 [Thermosporothrix hazakensis]|uniref:Uncharacterized protein n=2 Tax=Thermosporothrix hazakensis TaxID=644383 RepID=A0A326UEF8_THEHA|nr:hypothetical protein [Thermosporothrix hazakensis]PZW24892.1 hypothetical protein EI42_04500 [Thermosporothrix hazakensis]
MELCEACWQMRRERLKRGTAHTGRVSGMYRLPLFSLRPLEWFRRAALHGPSAYFLDAERLWRGVWRRRVTFRDVQKMRDLFACVKE